jgi:CubicO group peptidase (beta-lactamase class C family)
VRINQLSLALLHLFGEPLPDVFSRELMGPLGASTDWRWEPYDDAWVELNGRRMPSVPGGTHWGGGLRISARDLARLGQLVLDEGRAGGQVLVSPAWVHHMRQPTALAPFYGWLMWLNRDGQAFPGASPKASLMVGAGGHFVWVEPAFDAVVVLRWVDTAHWPVVMRAIGEALAAG